MSTYGRACLGISHGWHITPAEHSEKERIKEAALILYYCTVYKTNGCVSEQTRDLGLMHACSTQVNLATSSKVTS